VRSCAPRATRGRHRRRAVAVVGCPPRGRGGDRRCAGRDRVRRLRHAGCPSTALRLPRLGILPNHLPHPIILYLFTPSLPPYASLTNSRCYCETTGSGRADTPFSGRTRRQKTRWMPQGALVAAPSSAVQRPIATITSSDDTAELDKTGAPSTQSKTICSRRQRRLHHIALRAHRVPNHAPHPAASLHLKTSPQNIVSARSGPSPAASTWTRRQAGSNRTTCSTPTIRICRSACRPASLRRRPTARADLPALPVAGGGSGRRWSGGRCRRRGNRPGGRRAGRAARPGRLKWTVHPRRDSCHRTPAIAHGSGPGNSAAPAGDRKAASFRTSDLVSQPTPRGTRTIDARATERPSGNPRRGFSP